MTQRVLIPLPGVGTLALDEEAYRRALEDGAKFHSVPEPVSDPNERLLDSQQLAEILQAPVTWIEQQAREGEFVRSIRRVSLLHKSSAPLPPLASVASYSLKQSPCRF
jgi:hypothetical protein